MGYTVAGIVALAIAAGGVFFWRRDHAIRSTAELAVEQAKADRAAASAEADALSAAPLSGDQSLDVLRRVSND